MTISVLFTGGPDGSIVGQENYRQYYFADKKALEESVKKTFEGSKIKPVIDWEYLRGPLIKYEYTKGHWAALGYISNHEPTEMVMRGRKLDIPSMEGVANPLCEEEEA